MARAAQARSDAIRDIDRQRDLNAQLAGELQAAQQKLQAALRTHVGRCAGGRRRDACRSSRSAADLDWPTAGTVRRRFREADRRPRRPRRTASKSRRRKARPVSAVHEGVVAFADTFSGFGNLVILDHGAQAFSLYGNLLDIGVKKGARVEAGQPVGTVGASLTGPAGLYFEMRVDGQPVDPLQWLKNK